VTHLSERLPKNIGEETNEDVCLDAITSLMPNGPNLQIGFLDTECRLGFGQLDVSSPQ
jgi:hypothetical protein